MAKKYVSGISKIVFLMIILAVWEWAATHSAFGAATELVFPSLESIGKAFIKIFTKGYADTSFVIYILNSLKLLLKGLMLGVFFAFFFSGLAVTNTVFYQIYNVVVSVCDLLPGVALLPVVIIIFGINQGVIVFLVVHAVIWPMSRSVLDGFMAVPQIYIEVGKNIGLSGVSLFKGVYLPATMPYIMSGIKGGWARAWRGLISAEMIFGIASCPGIGFFINQMRVNMNNAEMYATLVVIVIIGSVVQYGILMPIENITIKKWGMTR